MKEIQGSRYRWQLPETEPAAFSELASRYKLSFPVIQTLFERGYRTAQDVENFLFTHQEQSVGDARMLKDAEKAVDRILAAIKNKEKILIAGDYDVDGITATALMMLCLLPLGAQVNFFLPHRVYDGYGLGKKTVTRAAQSGYKVIITVDNGITAFEACQEAEAHGVDVIITDHHRPHDELPRAYAIVDPCQGDCTYPYKTLAGVGVAFKVITLLYERLGRRIPDQVYELLLFGTVADVVPLTGENRFWVRYGLQRINNDRETHALRVLKQNSQFARPLVSAMDVGFSFAPQLNALGRLDDPRDGVKFLIGHDEQETSRIGVVLHELNQARKQVERKIVADVERDIASGVLHPEKDLVLIASRPDWPTGVIGLAASRIMNEYGRPVILLHQSRDGLAKGSCRSISAFNIFDALQQCSDILKKFGGHAAAAGLSLAYKDIPLLKERLESIMRKTLTDDDLVPKISIDAELSLLEAGKKLVNDLAYLEPFGCENPKPVFYIKHVTLVDEPVLLKDLHVKCSIFADGVIKPVIFFNRPELFAVLKGLGQSPFSLAVEVVENYWQGRHSVEFHGVDIAGDIQ